MDGAALTATVVALPFPDAPWPLENAVTSAGSARGDETSTTTAVRQEFFLGPENRQVRTAVELLATEQWAAVNPLVLHGPTGVGKSHLLRGLAAHWVEQHPHDQVVVLTATQFAHAFAHTTDLVRLMEIRERWRNADLLVMDDLQALANKPTAQVELLFLLDALQDRGARCVFASRVDPQQISRFSAAIRSRLASGINLSVAAPGPETRLVLLQQLARERGLTLSAAAIRALADGVSGTAVELRSALVELDALSRIEKHPPNVAAVRQLLSRRLAKRPSIGVIATVTAKYFGLKTADLRSPSRRRAIVNARGLAIYLARQLTGQSLEHVGRHFGGRDHTTVLHSYRSTEERLRTDAGLRTAVTELRKLIALA